MTTDITTRAQPDPDLLKRARNIIATEREFFGLFDEPPSIDWLADNLSVRLSARWGGRDFGDAWEVSLYLADEYFQTKAKPLLVVNRTTGEEVTRLPAEAMWVPDPVPRESGTLAQPLPRLRPDVEAALVERVHEQDREHRELARRAEGRQGDTAILTRVGRSSLASQAFEQAMQRFPGELSRRLGRTVSPGGGVTERVLRARVDFHIPDLSAMNTHFHFGTWLVQRLVREWCHAVVDLMSAEAAGPAPLEAMSLWIGQPDQVAWALQTTGQQAPRSVWARADVFLKDGQRLLGVNELAYAVSTPPLPTVGCRIDTQTINSVWRVEAELPILVARLPGRLLWFDAPESPPRTEVVR